MGAKRAYPDIVLGIDLLQTFQLRLAGDDLALHGGGGSDHGFGLFFDVDGGVLAGKVSEFFFRRLQILLDLLQPFFQKDSLASSRGRRQLVHDLVELRNVFRSHGGGSARIVVGDRDGDDPILAIARNRGILGQSPAGAVPALRPVHCFADRIL